MSSPETSAFCCFNSRTTRFSPLSNGARFRSTPPTAHLSEPRGVFTSLYLQGELRGCVGYVLPVSPVYRAVADTARAAAFEDMRFRPVTPPEARELEIELSILSPPRPISADAVEIGRHGLLIFDGRTPRPAPPRKCPQNTTGTAPHSSSRPAAKPACLSMPGNAARQSKPSRLRSSGTNTRN